MPHVDPALLEPFAHQALEWIGFGTLVGLTAKAIMPGRDPGGSIVTLLLGIVGTVIGCGVTMLVSPEDHASKVTPISLIGFGVGTGGAFILLLFYRLLSGRLFPSMHTDHVRQPHYQQRSRSRSRNAGTTIINND